MPEQSEHHQQDEVDDQQRIIEKGEKEEVIGLAGHLLAISKKI